MNIALLYNDVGRFWTVGSYILKELAGQDDVNVVTHCRIPEDTGILEKASGLDIDLILVIDDGGTFFKIHHHKGKLPDKVKTAVWLSDLHRPDWAAWRLDMIKYWKYDHVFYAQKNFKEKVMKMGYTEKECSWLPHAADPDIFKPMPHIKKRHDVGYVGFKNDKRIKYGDVLNGMMRFKQFDSAWAWMACRRMNEIKIGLNISVEDDVCNMRTFETMACGLPLLINKVENNGMEDLFESDMYLAFNDEKELKELAVRLLASNALRKDMGDKARGHVLTHHTYRNRINTLLDTMGFPMLKSY